MSEPIKSGLFPVLDRNSAVTAMRYARLSINSASQRGFDELEITEAKRQFREFWVRKREELSLFDLPEDPFEDDSDLRAANRRRVNSG
jgi:hypothetical protein